MERMDGKAALALEYFTYRRYRDRHLLPHLRRFDIAISHESFRYGFNPEVTLEVTVYFAWVYDPAHYRNETIRYKLDEGSVERIEHREISLSRTISPLTYQQPMLFANGGAVLIVRGISDAFQKFIAENSIQSIQELGSTPRDRKPKFLFR